MAEYTFGSEPNSYRIHGSMRITRERDGRTVIVNRKEGYWALNVKAEYVMRQRDPRVQTAAANLTDGLLSGLEESTRDFFWREIEHLALSHGFNGNVFQEGRSGGWACVDETRNFESESPANPHPEEREQVANWIAFCFDADDLRQHAERSFDERILEANQDLQVELSEYAAWIGARVSSPDGHEFTVERLDVRHGRAIFTEKKPAKGFSFATEVTLLDKGTSELPFTDCPGCGRPYANNAPGHSTGCVIGALLTVLEDRGFDFDGADISRIDADGWWETTFGPAADAIEAELKGASEDRVGETCANCGGPDGYPGDHAVGCPLSRETKD